MFGVDVMITEDLQSAVALEVNGTPQIKEGMDEDMQLGMMEVVLGEKLPRDRARKKGAGVAADGWLELGAAAVAGGAGEGGPLLAEAAEGGARRRAATQTQDLSPCCPYL
jgi:hypothetical protein